MGADALDEGGQGGADFGDVGDGAVGQGVFLVLARLGVGADYHGYGFEVRVGLKVTEDSQAVLAGQDEVKDDECQVYPRLGKMAGVLDETVPERMRGFKLPCRGSPGSNPQGWGSGELNCGYR
jgi:hypothetical protein